MEKLFKNIVPICFIILAGYLAIHDKEGWGWCLFLALLTYDE